MQRLRFVGVAVLVVAGAVVSVGAHITPGVILRRQADVIRETLPKAVKYAVTTVKIDKAQLQQLVDQGHFRPDTDRVKFYTGRDQSGALVGTVVFPQFDTQHGPIEVGVTIDPQGALTSVLVTRATVEMKPWVLEVEKSRLLDALHGTKAGAEPRRISEGHLGGMPGYMADAIATAAYRGLALYAVLDH